MQDPLYIIVSIFIIALIVVIGMFFMNVTSSSLLALSENNSIDKNVTNYTIVAAKTTFTSTYDGGFIVVFVLMFASSMILGSLLPTNPIFFIPFVFVLLLIVIITAIVSNIWNTFITNPVISSTAAEFVYIPFVMANLPFLTAGLGFMLSIVVYTAYARR